MLEMKNRVLLSPACGKRQVLHLPIDMSIVERMLNVSALKTGWITVKDASEMVGVTVQRMHQLIKTYELETDEINPRLKTVREKDVTKLKEMERPDGVRIDRRSRAG